ncbi:MAG: hypothetical protein ACRDXX_19215 [Stackebrandtia sp.]
MSDHDRAASYRWYRCATSEAHVNLVVPPTMGQSARELLEPYIAVSQIAPELDDAAWRVRAPDGDADAGDHDLVAVTPDGEPTTEIRFSPSRREVLLHLPADEGFMTQNAVRFVRILLRLSHASREEIFIHGGMVHRHGRGAAILGDKRAGKTSTVLAAAMSGAAFVSNDDLSLRQSEAGWTGRGWPRSISVRKDTFPALGVSLREELQSRNMSLRHPANASVDELLPAGERNVGAVLLYASELGRVFDAPLMTESPVDAFVFPRFVDDPRPKLRRLSPVETAERVAANLLPNPVKYSDFLLPYFPFHADRRDQTDLVRKAAAMVPGFELRQRFDALHAGARAVARLLEKGTQ